MKNKVLYAFIACVLIIIVAIFAKGFKSGTYEIDFAVLKADDKPITEDFVVNRLQRKDSYYYYNELDDFEKKVYSVIARNVKTLKKTGSFEASKLEKEEISKKISRAFSAFNMDHPEVFYLQNKYQLGERNNILKSKYYVDLYYTVGDKNELESQIKKLETAIKEKTDIIQISDEKIKNEILLHDKLATDLTYDYTKSDILVTHTSYGALVDKIAVCDGMTKALQLLYDKADIPTVIVTGSINSGPHAWLKANINDKWYNVDITSDKSLKSLKDVVIHSYFNITDDLILKSHITDQDFKYPEAIDENNRYYDYMKTDFSNSLTFETDLNNLYEKDKEKKIIEFKVDTKFGMAESKITNVFSNNNAYTARHTDNKILYYKLLDTYIIET